MPDDNVEQRLTALEESVAQYDEAARAARVARLDAAAARELSSGAYEEVGQARVELRAHTSTLNALRETQLEHGEQIAELRAATAQVQAGIAQITRLLTHRIDEADSSDDSVGG
ncbi:hypothetical protein ABZ639_26965 [Saccharomonospora sp. NPDC006951]